MDQRLVRGSDLNTVQLEKYESCGYAGALVPIYKRVAPDDMEEVSSRHLKEIGMQVLVAYSSLRHGEGGLEEPKIPDAFSSAVSRYLVVVNLQDLFEAEKEWRQRG